VRGKFGRGDGAFRSTRTEAFRRAAVALKRLHPEQYQYVFGDGLSAKSGPEAVGSVQVFLDRYVALRDGSDAGRADKKEADRAAAATLEARNIVNREIEGELRELIEVVKNPAPLPEPVPVSASEEALQQAAKAFQVWLGDWRPTAAAGITRRDYRIMLGISKRRLSKPAAPVAAAAGAGTAAPAAVAGRS
jgi:hypothetical protein